jgi:hypothetical protein
MEYLGALAVVAAYLILAYIGGGGDLTKCFEGADGRYSTSKFQFFLWTGVIVFGYVAITIARASRGNHDVIADVPQHLLTVMGFSATTLAAAKGITVAYVSNGQAPKVAPAALVPPAPPGGVPPPTGAAAVQQLVATEPA